LLPDQRKADADHRDRHVGLILFGILEILIGGVCSLMIPLMLFATAIASRRPDAPPAPPMPVLVMLIYGFIAAGFIWLGIGSILARRWARAILACLSGVALCGGILGGAWAVFFLPRFWAVSMSQPGQPALPPAALATIKIITVVSLGVIYVLIPGALFLFYRSRHVRRTCELRDPVERWTDRCPLPVLAFSLVAALCGIGLLAMLGAIHVFPVFGLIVSGGPAILLGALFAAFSLYLAWGFYHLNARAWWLALFAQLAYAASSAISVWRIDFAALYLKLGFDPRLAASSAQVITSPGFGWFTLFPFLACIAWLLLIRSHFSKPGSTPGGLDGLAEGGGLS